jgi:hypothetical protein
VSQPFEDPESRSAMVARWFHDVWPALAAAVGVAFILLDFLSTGAAHLNGLSGIGMAFCGVLPVVHYDRARKG